MHCDTDIAWRSVEICVPWCPEQTWFCPWLPSRSPAFHTPWCEDLQGREKHLKTKHAWTHTSIHKQTQTQPHRISGAHWIHVKLLKARAESPSRGRTWKRLTEVKRIQLNMTEAVSPRQQIAEHHPELRDSNYCFEIRQPLFQSADRNRRDSSLVSQGENTNVTRNKRDNCIHLPLKTTERAFTHSWWISCGRCAEP